MVALVWATRGRNWGFRFLLDGGMTDPLDAYERAFAAGQNENTLFRRVAGDLAVRFEDPDGRCDASGRVIPHEFVVLGGAAMVDDGEESVRNSLWEPVRAVYESVWLNEQPPARSDVRAAMARL